MIKKNYKTDSGREELLSSMTALGKILIEDARLTDGNYLTFIDPDEVEPYILEPSLREPTDLEILREQVAENQGAIDFILMNF